MTTINNNSLVKISQNFRCDICNYTASRKYNLDIHLNSIKHKTRLLTTNDNDSLVKISKSYQCQNCDKEFNDRAGLWRHNKKCINNEYKEYYFENLNTNNINDTNELNRICSELYINDNLDYRIYILNNLYKYHNELCLEHFYKINVQYLYNPEVELNELMLIKIIKESQLSIEMKYECAKLIYFENKENKENKENITYFKTNNELENSHSHIIIYNDSENILKQIDKNIKENKINTN